LYKTFPCTLPVPGAGFTFSTPVSPPPPVTGDGAVAEGEFVDGEDGCPFWLLPAQPANEIAAIAQKQATSILLKFMT
jgi:hypothetical protein